MHTELAPPPTGTSTAPVAKPRTSARAAADAADAADAVDIVEEIHAHVGTQGPGSPKESEAPRRSGVRRLGPARSPHARQEPTVDD